MMLSWLQTLLLFVSPPVSWAIREFEILVLFASVLEGLASVGSGSLVRFTPQRNFSLEQIRSISNGVDICLFGEAEFICIQILCCFQTPLFVLVIHFAYWPS